MKSSTQHVVAFQRQRSQKKFHILQEANESVEDIKVHYNLLDCGIYVCSPHMPQLLTDNFDYQTTDDFVRGVLGSEEILGNSIHLHVLKDQYALRASNLYMYHVVSLDVLKRWSYPFVPDSSILELPNGRLVYYSDNVYRHQSVKLAPTCELLENVAVDAGSKIGSKTIISNSTIGASCIIGENVKINGCHIWSGTIIEDNAVITDSILDMNVFVGKGTCINSRCILGHGVKIGEGITLQEGTRLVGQSLNGLEPLQSGSVAAFFYRMPSSTELEETEDLECAVWEKHFVDDEDEEEDEDDDDDDGNSAGGELDDDEASEAKAFEEMLINLDRALDEEVSAQNVILEMNSIKHAYGIQIQSLTTMLIKAILELPFRRLGSRQIEAKKFLEICVQFVKKFLPLLQNYIKNLLSEQMALSALEQFAFENSKIVSVLPKVAQTLYSMDVLSEDGILAWWKSKERMHGETLRIAMKSFIEWLENAEEESD